MEEGFVRAVHTGTGLEQDIPLTWFDAFPGVWRVAGVEAKLVPGEFVLTAEQVEQSAPITLLAPAPAVPVPDVAPATAPAPEGDAA